MRRVTFSRNYTLSLSRTCQCYCKYCAFATHQAHLHAPEEVERPARPGGAAQRQGAARAHRRAARGQPGGRRSGCGRGATTTSSPTSSGPASGRSSAGCCRTPTSACSRREDLGPPARGDRLAGADARVDLRAADGDGPRRARRPSTRRVRLETIEAAGELRIPFTSGILVGIGETEEERVASLEALAEVHARHGHIQEVILQNFVPHPQLLRARGGGDRRRRARGALGVGRRLADSADERRRDAARLGHRRSRSTT